MTMTYEYGYRLFSMTNETSASASTGIRLSTLASCIAGTALDIFVTSANFMLACNLYDCAV